MNEFANKFNQIKKNIGKFKLSKKKIIMSEMGTIPIKVSDMQGKKVVIKIIYVVEHILM